MRLPILSLLLPFVVACGDDEGTGGQTGSTTSSGAATTGASQSGTSAASGTTTATSTGTTTGTSSASTGSGSGSGDCDTAADCGGDPCVELSPSGFRVCQRPVVEATQCTAPGLDACCNSSECNAGETCFFTPIVPFCAGVQMRPHNECARDQCGPSVGIPCEAGAVCAPPGTIDNDIAFCLSAGCLVDADCVGAAGGVCATVREPCCNNVAMLACVYPDGCRASSDCDNGETCAIVGNQTVCTPDPPICPA